MHRPLACVYAEILVIPLCCDDVFCQLLKYISEVSNSWILSTINLKVYEHSDNEKNSKVLYTTFIEVLHKLLVVCICQEEDYILE